MSEDQYWAYDVLRAGFEVAYHPAAQVFHSHNYSLGALFNRNWQSGASLRGLMADHPLAIGRRGAVVHRRPDSLPAAQRPPPLVALHARLRGHQGARLQHGHALRPTELVSSRYRRDDRNCPALENQEGLGKEHSSTRVIHSAALYRSLGRHYLHIRYQQVLYVASDSSQEAGIRAKLGRDRDKSHDMTKASTQSYVLNGRQACRWT